MLMTDPSELSRTLKCIKPTHVAVAYLGNAWQKYLTDLDTLEEIIVSPTIGSYPGALEVLLDKAERHGFKVFFSEKLHAKLFIGKNSCLIGSSNLSHNGFGGGLNEAAVHLTGEQYIQQAEVIFKSLKVGAVADPDQQHQMLKHLKLKWQRARNSNIFPNENDDKPEPLLADWKQGQNEERVILSWYYIDGETPPNEKNIKAELTDFKDGHINEYWKDYLDFAANDDIREGDWLLCWAVKTDGTPDKRKSYSPYWMQVNKVIANGSGDESHNYRLLAIEFKTDDHGIATKPFTIDRLVRDITQQILEGDDYAVLKPDGDRTWRYKEVKEENQRFLDQLQQTYREKTYHNNSRI